jgi:hypothetical protein
MNEHLPTDRWIRKRVAWLGLWAVVLVAGGVTAILAGVPIETAIWFGPLGGLFAMGYAIALAQIAVPGRVLRVRAWMMEGRPQAAKRIADVTDQIIGSGGPKPWENPKALRRIRMFGLLSLPLYVLMFAFFLLRAGSLGL